MLGKANLLCRSELAFILSKLELVVKCYDCSGVNVMKRTLPFLFGFLCFPPAFTYAQAGRNFDAVQVETKQVQGNIYMLVGAGGNVTVQVGADGVCLWTPSSRRWRRKFWPLYGNSQTSRSSRSRILRK